MADGKRLSKRQHYWERPEYWEESWRPKETCCHSDSCEKPSANTDVKNSKGVNYNNNNNNNNNNNSEKRDKYIDLTRELKKTIEHESEGDNNCSWYAWNNSQKIGKGPGDLEIQPN